MNKKKIMYALSFGILLFAASCGNKTGEAPPTEPADTGKKTFSISAPMHYITETKKNNKDVLDTTDFSKAAFSLVKERIRILSMCVGSYCSDPNNYCDGNDTCLRKIKDCHTIDNETFDLLTSNGQNGYAVFTYNATIDSMLKADCKKYIKLTSSAINYGMEIVSTIDTTIPNTAHYSAALWQKIAENPIDSIKIYKAIYEPSTKKYLIPFKVHFPGGGVEVYDVSSDLP